MRILCIGDSLTFGNVGYSYIPFLRTVSLFWKMQMTVRCKIKHCLEEDEDFYGEYEKCLSFLQQKNKKIIIIGLPFIEMKDYPHSITERRNKKLKELAVKYNCPYIDIFGIQKDLLKDADLNYSWKWKYPIRIADYMIMTILPFTKDSFAKFRKLQLTVDGAHFNSISAKALAEEIEKSIIVNKG